MLRLILPPNLPAAAARDAIPVRIELDGNQVPAAGLLPALALLQGWCATPEPPPLVQLTRQQLRELASRLVGQPVFFGLPERDHPLPWSGNELIGVSPVLVEPDPPADPPGVPPARKPQPAGRTENRPAGMQVDGSEHYLSIGLPSREHPHYADARDLLRNSGFILEPSNRRWWLRDRHKTLTFLARHREELERVYDAAFTDNFRQRTAHLHPATVEVRVEEAAQDYDVSISLEAGAAPTNVVQEALIADRGYLEVGDQIILLPPEQIRALTAAQARLAGKPGTSARARIKERVPATRAAELHEVLESLSPNFQPAASWIRRSAGLRSLSQLDRPPLPEAFAAGLRPYQELGVAWLWHLYRDRLGGILADEMGLGKTVQALGLIWLVRRADPEATGPVLVVVPASLLENWHREAIRFVPELRVHRHHGADRATRLADAEQADLILTSYGTLARDGELLNPLNLGLLVADEAQHVKNRRSQNAAALRALRTPARFFLTGTPLENSLDDLRSLFDILLPGYLAKVPDGLRGEDRAWYDRQLRDQSAPYILRRTKGIVAPDLPERIEQVLWCELGGDQAALYRRLQEQGAEEMRSLEKANASDRRLRFAALTQLLRLRQVCCDPRLIPAKEQSVDPSTVSSAKLEALLELTAEAADDGHRILLFSQFTSLLRLLRTELETNGVTCAYLDGSLPPAERQREVDRFQSSPEIAVFLLSLKAGGTGLNLTAADTVIHFDPWWNPAAEAQATDRAHRIGQTRVVTSYKLIAAGTVEEKVLALQAHKRALLADIFEASEAAAERLSLADLRALL